jgi:hypothetical protein
LDEVEVWNFWSRFEFLDTFFKEKQIFVMRCGFYIIFKKMSIFHKKVSRALKRLNWGTNFKEISLLESPVLKYFNLLLFPFFLDISVFLNCDFYTVICLNTISNQEHVKSTWKRQYCGKTTKVLN